MSEQTYSTPFVRFPHADELSFVTRNFPFGSGLNFWKVEPTGNYADDCEAGAALGNEFIDFLGKQPTADSAQLLGCIVATMAHVGGVEIGFLRVVNEYAMAAATLVATLEGGAK